jgi:hypothetical protein
MKEHVIDLVDFYMDGEIGPTERSRIEAHLAVCSPCGEYYAQRNRLSSLLKSQPVKKTRTSDRQFAAAVMEKIPNRPQAVSVGRPRREDLSWIWIPILLVIGLVFIQTVWVESNLVQFVPQVDEVLQPGQLFLPFSFALPTSLMETVKFVFGMNLMSWDWSTTVLLTIALSFLYVSWLAGWWIRGQKRTELRHSKMEL